MSGEVKIDLGEGTAESVALKLYWEVIGNEAQPRRDRKYILDTYAECLKAVKNPAARLSRE